MGSPMLGAREREEFTGRRGGRRGGRVTPHARHLKQGSPDDINVVVGLGENGPSLAVAASASPSVEPVRVRVRVWV